MSGSMGYGFLGPSVPRCGRPWSRRLWSCVLRAAGWSVEGKERLDLARLVLIAAPHTSNWDFVLAMIVRWAVGLDFRWIGKHTLFRWPFGWLFRAIGGMAVDRTHNQGLVAAAIALFEKQSQLMLAVTPEGTRSRVDRWKTGFYHIAHGANVPIVCAYLDYTVRVVHLAAPFYPTGDLEADISLLRQSYEPYRRKGRRPENG